jgi:mannitol-1-/sugar-/sorbitol-6-/2-deoxyglucose-6-phosphatase
MPTKTDKDPVQKSPAETEAPAAPTKALLFQLEDIAVEGRKATFSVLKKLLGEHKVDLPLPLFSRYCLNFTLESGISRLLQEIASPKIETEKLINEARSEIVEKLSKQGEINPGLTKILRGAADQKVSIGVTSGLPEADAQALCAKLGLQNLGAIVFAYKENGNHFPSAKIWLRTAKTMNLKARNCAVIGASAAACKSALAADMRCLAVPDEYTSFQDFSGAETVLESLGDLTVAEVYDMLFPVEIR